MAGTGTQRKSDTRQRIQDIALDLFVEQGYEKTSLREIAERLEVTKAALYYHFKTKESILVSLFADRVEPLDELIAWAREQPRTLEVKQEFLRRYTEQLKASSRLFRFMQENQAELRDLRVGETFKSRVDDTMELLLAPDPSLADRVRCTAALISLHAGMFALKDVEGDPEEKYDALLEVSFELLAAAHEGRGPAA
ncbi:TetR/AcrR family transcriptional regulator [Streptomyces montanisoli]|uniref:TetR/AcrR family transcriptional regulator n=1 Tax=Streptomyces montanisoli TaxID=2798581 RepID=A0A940MDS7_9ACTN|nr:TetR/AcrR family transcriptional regulator [Streptomyces montanisoli]MBP0461189.1 TetR/AcrR family transcriptional regulator [Streptomyces montanisoli]